MFWIKLFWFEAFAVPIYFLWEIAQAAPGAPYRMLNLTIWGLTLLAAIASFAWTKRRAQTAKLEESS